VVDVREGTTVKLSVQYDSAGTAQAISFNGTKVLIELERRPRVQTIAGRNVIGGFDPSLGGLEGPQEGATARFAYSINERTQPTLTITGTSFGEQTYTWNPGTRSIISDQTWSYQIIAATSRIRNAVITRIDGKGRREVWDDSGDGSRVESQLADGTRVVATRFVSGVMYGKTRSIEWTAVTGESKKTSFIYDENGELLRTRSTSSAGPNAGQGSAESIQEITSAGQLFSTHGGASTFSVAGQKFRYHPDTQTYTIDQ
jgi:hypothetical protein